MLIHKKSSKFVNNILNELAIKECVIFADKKIKKLYKGKTKSTNAKIWSTEFLSAKISVKLVNDITEAINHINKFGTMHTDAIITENQDVAEIFLNKVDSAIVMLNASTQFADGAEFGMGAEIGISTGKLHARGPVGVEQLTSSKYVVRGTGQCRL